jgi:hypothetical protein
MLENMTLKELKEKIANDDLDWSKISKDEITDVLKFEKMENITDVNRMQNWISALNTIKKEAQIKINQNIANFARSVFRHEGKNHGKTKQCVNKIKAYDNLIDFIDEYIAEIELIAEHITGIEFF